MADSIAKRAHTILRQLVGVEESLRDAEAERLCGDEPALRSRVRDLLEALSRTSDFLESPIGQRVREAAQGADSPGLPRVTGFRIVRLVGLGGMAAVYEAVQDMPRRRVALKVLRRSMAGTAALRRFEFETEVLAKLRHPGIAQIYEAGTFDDGAGAMPFFAMEYVESARTLTEFCNERELGLRERLELFVRVCDAVQHGHQNGVIHRDLKPGNVLVDQEGRPLVIDFGIARSSAEAGQQGQTTVGQIIGTLNAMSPEQCSPNANVDARTDVYSLGVLLYELLCKRVPHELGSLPVPEALRIIHDVAPPRPSSIDARLRGDLEAITLKAMEKSPDRRYPTVAALGSDIRRYLNHETVEARSPTFLYQLHLFARRNRAFVAAASVVLLALTAITGVSVMSMLRIKEALADRVAADDRAREERDNAVRKTYIANIASALLAQAGGDGVQMAQMLDAAPEEARGWEWRWLSGVSNQSISVIEAHRVNILAMSFDAEQSAVRTIARDGSLSEISLERFEQRGLVAGSADSLLAVAMLDDGRFVAITRDGRGFVRQPDNESADLTIDPKIGVLAAVASLEGDSVVFATAQGELFRWSIASGVSARHVSGLPRVEGLAVSDDRRLVAAWHGGHVALLNADTLEIVKTWQDDLDVGCVLIRPDLDIIAVGHANGQVALRSIREDRPRPRLGMRDRVSLVRSLALNADGSQLAIGQGNGVITLVELPSTGDLGQFLGHQDAVVGLQFVRGGSQLVSASWDRTVRLWDVDSSTVNSATVVDSHRDQVLSVSFDGSLEPNRASRIASAGKDRVVKVTDVESYVEELEIREHKAELYDAEFSPDGSMIATAGNDGVVCLFDTKSGDLLVRLDGHGGAVWSVSWSPDGTLLASGGDDASVRIWEVASRTLQQTLVGHEDRVISVTFSHDGKRVASTSRDSTVRLWSLDAPQRPQVLVGHDWDVFAAVWSLDDELLYTGSRDQSIRVWSTVSGAEVSVIRGFRQFVTSLALSPDSSRLVAGTWFGSVVFVDPKRYEVIATVRPVVGSVRGVSFSADGHRLAIAGSDGKVRVLDDRPASERAQVEEVEPAR